MDEPDPRHSESLRTYIQVLARRRLIVALSVLAVVGLALAYSFLQKPEYSASARVLLPQQDATAALNPSAANANVPAATSAERTLADDLQFAQGDTVKQAAERTLGYSAKVTVSASATADVLTFQALSGNKSRAAQTANTYANVYIVARRQNQVNQYTQQVTALQTSITQLQQKAAALKSSDPDQAALQQSANSLTQTLQQLQAASQLVNQGGPSVVTNATAPSSPVSPKPLTNGVLALIVGLLLGVAGAFLADRLDDAIRTRQDAEVATGGLPIVGMIPIVDAWKGKTGTHLALVEDPTSPVSEAYRTLRTAVQFLSIDEPRKVIGITSSGPGEGKTTTVANLAVSLARAGDRVIVVSCDLRRPRLHVFFGEDNRRGLTSVLLGETSLRGALRNVKDEPRLRVLTSGPVPPNPAEILSLDRVREVVDVLADASDTVIIDCPPVLPVTDTLLLSRLVDGILVISSAGETSRRDLARTCELLRQVQAPLLGTILNRVPEGSEYAYGSGYGYYGNYEQEGPVATPNGSTADGSSLSKLPIGTVNGDIGEEADFQEVAKQDHAE